MPAKPESTERDGSGQKFISLGPIIFVVVVGFSLLVGAAWWIAGPIISAATLKSLRGVTQTDVRRILGEPAEVMPYGDWIYDRRPNPGWVAISFDDNGRVRSVNDEQADPVTFGSGSWSQ